MKEMDEALEALRLLMPTDPTPYAYALIQRVMAGQATAAAAALDDYFLRFCASVKSVQLLAQPLAEIGAVDLLEQFIKKMAEQDDRRSALLLLAQAHLKHGQWSAAEQVIAQVEGAGCGGRWKCQCRLGSNGDTGGGDVQSGRGSAGAVVGVI